MSQNNEPIGIGVRIGDRFVIHDGPIGEGRTGTVWGGTDEITNSPVALKVLHTYLVDDPLFRERMLAETGVLVGLELPGAVPTLGVWNHNGRWIVVARRISGAALDNLPEIPWSTPTAIEFALNILMTLERAHQLGLVHGDVRPGNILVGKEGAFLFDFGFVNLPLEIRSVVAGQTAPELWLGGKPSQSADVYGLGIVLYRVLTGRLPFSSGNPLHSMGAQRQGIWDVTSLPNGLAVLLSEMLSPNPLLRPSLAAVRWSLHKLSKTPTQRANWKPWVASWRMGNAWSVVVVDPATGRRLRSQRGLARREVKRVSKQLMREGWKVEPLRHGLDGWDLAWIVVVIVIFSLLIPILGPVIGAGLGLWWRSVGVVEEPKDGAGIPLLPKSLGEVGRAPILLTVLGAAIGFTTSILVFLPLAPLWALLALWIVIATWRRHTTIEQQALKWRVEVALDAVYARLERLPMEDRWLSATAALEHSITAWRCGHHPTEQLLEQVEVLERQLPDSHYPISSHSLIALRKLEELG